jgi:hypothetical protein
MKEFIDKLIERLEEIYNGNDKLKKEAYEEQEWERFDFFTHKNEGIYIAISIANKLAEEYKDKSSIIDDLKAFLKEKFKYNSEQAEIWRDGSDNDAYFRQQKDLYMDRANIYGEVMREIDRLSEEYKGGCCEWKQYDENDIYYTGCEQIHMFIDGSPTDNKYEFCPYCGKKIKVAPYTEGE